MASLIPLDGDMWSRLRAEKQTKERIPYVDKTPSLGQMMAIGQVGAQALGGLGNMVIQGVGAHQAQTAWDEANQKYRSEQEATQQEAFDKRFPAMTDANQNALVATERDALTQQAIRHREEQAAMMGQKPWSMATPVGTERAMQEGFAPQQTVGQAVAPLNRKFAADVPDAPEGNVYLAPARHGVIPDQRNAMPAVIRSAFIDQPTQPQTVAQQIQPQSRFADEQTPPPDAMLNQFPQQPFTQQTRDLPYRQFADQKRAPIADLPTVGELRNMAFMAGQGNDPAAKQKVIDMMNRMPGAFGGPQNLTDVLTGGHEERGQQSVYDLMRQGHGKSPLEMALEQERINNLKSQKTARDAKAKRDAEASPLALRLKSLQGDLLGKRISKADYDAQMAELELKNGPEKMHDAHELAGAQIGELGTRSDLEMGKNEKLERETRAKEMMARAAASRAATDARRLNLQDRLNFFKRPEARVHDPANPVRGKLSSDLLDIEDKLNVLAEKLKIPVKDRDAMLMSGTEFARAVNASQASADDKQKIMAEYEGLKNSRESKAKALSAAGYDPKTYGATELGQPAAAGTEEPIQ